MAFSLTPGQNIDQVLNFDEKSHRAIYNNASAKLPIDAFDCVDTQLLDFMSALTKRAYDYGWVERILKIPLTLPEDPDTEYVNILTNHAKVSLNTIREYEESYVQQQTRARQDTHCLYTCVMDSLSQEGRMKVLNEKDKYLIEADPTDNDNDELVPSGNLLLKVVLMKSSVDNRSGSYSIRMKLAELDNLITRMDFDIEKFNDRVKSYLEDLSRRGETSDDVNYNLIKAYKTVPVREFVAFIDRLKDDDDNQEPEGRYTPQFIMDKAENKFKILVNENIWDTKMNEKDELMALRAEFDKLKKKTRKTGKGGKGGKKSTKKRVDITRKPKDIHKPVIIDGKEWYWCSKETGGKCNGVLRRHKPSECKGISKNAASSASTTSSKRSNSNNSNDSKKKLKIKAKETLINGEAEESDSDLSDEMEEGSTHK